MTLLHLLLLCSVFLLYPIGLLRVALFHLLFLRIVVIFPISLLVLFFLLLLYPLVLLILFVGQLALLLLVSPVPRRVPGIGWRRSVGLKFPGRAGG